MRARQDAPAPHVHDVVGRAHRRRAVPGQGRDPVRPGRRRGRHGARPGARPASRSSSASTWAAPRPTSSHFDGEYERAFETEVAGVRMRAPMMLIHTVAAGGGSILHFDGARFRVGPDSRRRQSRPEMLSPRRAARRHRRQRDGRQAHPGFLPEDLRPAAGPAARRRRRARRRSQRSRDEIGDGRSPEEIADGFIKIAVENMANAIKKISVQRGYDVTRYALNCFGGAGGQHACLVADALGMTTVLIHPFSSLLSAYGMGLADIRATRQQAIEEPFGAKSLAAHRARSAARLGEDAERRGRRPGRRPRRRSRCIVRAHIRYAGTDTALRGADVSTPASCAARSAQSLRMKSAFKAAQGALRLHRPRARRLVVEAVSVEAVGGGAQVHASRSHADAPASRRRRPRDARASTPAAHGTTPRSITREQLAPGHKVDGPAIIIEPHQTIVRRGRLAGRDHRQEPSRARRASCALHARAARSAPTPIRSCSKCSTTCSCRSPSRWACRCRTPPIRSTSRSGSISPARCSTRDGTLVANAPHMPVHLGSMDRSVETIIRENKGRIAPGDVYAINAPYNGGTHLPDITVCTPVFDDAGRDDPVLGRLARPSRRCRRHLAGLDVAERDHDRGGRRLYRQFQAGRPRPLPRAGALRRCSPARNIRRATRCRTSTTSRRRSPPTRRACRSCARWWRSSRCRWCEAYMSHVQDNAAESVRRVIDRLHDCAFAYEMDQGTVIKVRITRRQGEARGDRRFHRHLAAAADQLQRARAGDARRRALRVPRHGRRRHPDERRLPAADQHHHPEELDAVAGISRRGRRRQCRDLAGGDRTACSARSARSPPRRAR